MRKPVDYPVLVGAAAGLAVLLISSSSLYVDFEETKWNFVAELAGVLLEVALVVLFLDVILERRERARWAPAYRELVQGLATYFVDVMRVLLVRAGTTAVYSRDRERVPEFLRRATGHRDSSQSQLESCAGAMDPSDYVELRQIESKVSWVFGRLQEGRERPVSRDFGVMKEAAETLAGFARRRCGTTEVEEQVRKTIDRYLQGQAPPGPGIDSIILARHGIQDELWRDVIPKGCGLPYVLDDSSQRASLPYFLLDRELFNWVRREGIVKLTREPLR